MSQFRIQIRVFVNNVSAERLWKIEKPIPPVQIATNLNLVEVNRKQEDILEVPFIFTINYIPPIAQISLKGEARVKGTKEDITKIHNIYVEKKPPPPQLFQSIFNVAFAESILITRTLNVPPPIPQIQPPSGQKKPQEPTYRA
jgi:hypothetical protein